MSEVITEKGDPRDRITNQLPLGVGQPWRIIRADALEATAQAIRDMLHHVDNVEAALADDEPLLTAGRTYAGMCRAKANELEAEAYRLRTPE